MLKSLLDSISKETNFIVELQRLLVSHPAMGPDNGGQGEKDKAEALKAFLANLGFPEPEEIRAPDPRVACEYRPSLSYVIPGRDTSRTFWILSHMDVVPVGELSSWHTNPFELSVQGDLIFGRGVEDNHQGIVSSVLLGKTILEAKAVPPMNLGLLFIADEETHNTYGLEYIVHHRRDLFKPNDLFLAPDSGAKSGLEIEIAEKSVLWLKIIVEGKQCHASTPGHGNNSLRAAADMIMRLETLAERFPASDPLFAPPTSTFEPTKKEANVENVNTIPGRDVFYLDCRVLPTIKLEDVINTIHAIGTEVEQARGVRVSYEILQAVQAAPATSPDCEIIKRLCAALHDEGLGEPTLIGIGGGTLAALLREEGLPAAVWAILGDQAHQPNESASLSATLRETAVMARTLFA